MTISEALDALRDARLRLYQASQQRSQFIALRRLTPARAEACQLAVDNARAEVDSCVNQVQTLLIEAAQQNPPPPVEEPTTPPPDPGGGLIIPDAPMEP